MARDHNAALATKSHEQTLSLREEKNWIRLNMESPMIAGSIENGIKIDGRFRPVDSGSHCR